MSLNVERVGNFLAELRSHIHNHHCRCRTNREVIMKPLPFFRFVPPILVLLLLLLSAGDSRAAYTNVIGWGYDAYGEATPPSSLTNALAIATGSWHSLALRSDGTVLAWGYNVHGETNVPTSVTNAVAISAGFYHSLALRSNGTVVGWGNNNGGATTIPTGLSNVVAISAGGKSGNGDFSVAVRSDGTVLGWGGSIFGGANGRIPAGLSNVVAISAGQIHCLALKNDGTVVAWDYGINQYGQATVPPNVTNVVAVAAGVLHSVVLQRDGTVFAWGANDAGQLNIPVGLSNVVAIAAGGSAIDTGGYTMALKDDGTIVSWGSLVAPAGITNAVAIAGTWSHALALTTDNLPRIVRQPWSQLTYGGFATTMSVGAVGAPPLSYQWLFNGRPLLGATNAYVGLTNLQPPDAGSYSVIVTNFSGSLTSVVAVLTVSTNPSIAIQPTNQSLVAGSTATLSVVASPGPIPITYQWQFNGTNILNATNASFTITSVQITNQGAYDVIVANPYASVVSSNATLLVFDLAAAVNSTDLSWTTSGNPVWVPQFTATHDGVAAAKSGRVSQNGQSILQTTALGPGTLTFWWKFANVNPPGDVMSFSCNANQQATLTTNTDWQLKAFYIATGSQLLQWTYSKNNNYYASTGYVDQVTWSPGGTSPILLSTPSNQCAIMGAPVTFSATTAGTPPIGYRWQFNGAPIAQATNAVLSLTNVKIADSGTYTVVVTNAFGAASTNAELAVQPFVFNTTTSLHSISTQGMQLTLEGVFAPHSFVLFASTDLVSWLPVLTNPPVTGSLYMIDTAATNLPLRFYRATEN